MSMARESLWRPRYLHLSWMSAVSVGAGPAVTASGTDASRPDPVMRAPSETRKPPRLAPGRPEIEIRRPFRWLVFNPAE